MNRTDKYFRSLDQKTRDIILLRLQKIKLFQWDELDIKKLKGSTAIFRDKYRETRIIFKVIDRKTIEIESITNRNEKTYK